MELWKVDDYLLSVYCTDGCLCMTMVFVNVFLQIMVIYFCVDFFSNKLTLAIFSYRVLGTYDDREPSFVGADGQE